MRTLLLFCTVFVTPLLASAQQKKDTPKQKPPAVVQHDENKVFTKIEIEGGPNQKEWQQYLLKAAVLPDSVAKEIPAGSYKVDVRFVIDKHGYIGQVQAKTDPGWGLAKRAEKIIRNYPGAWTPANQCGRSVNSYRDQQIVFVIAE